MNDNPSNDDGNEMIGDTEQHDISSANDPEEAAEMIRDALVDIADGMGQDGEFEVSMSYEDNYYGTPAYHISWPGGPFDWAVSLTGGESIYTSEFGYTGTPPEIVGFYDTDSFRIECKNGVTLSVYPAHD